MKLSEITSRETHAEIIRFLLEVHKRREQDANVHDKS